MDLALMQLAEPVEDALPFEHATQLDGDVLPVDATYRPARQDLQIIAPLEA